MFHGVYLYLSFRGRIYDLSMLKVCQEERSFEYYKLVNSWRLTKKKNYFEFLFFFFADFQMTLIILAWEGLKFTTPL